MLLAERATLATGRFYPAQNGVTLTHTHADLKRTRRNSPAVLGELRRG